MPNVDIPGLIIDSVDVVQKTHVGKIVMRTSNDDKAKYPLDHRCFTASLALLGQPVTVTYNPERLLIVSVRPIEIEKTYDVLSGD